MEIDRQSFERNFSECCSASRERLAHERSNQPEAVAAERRSAELYHLLEAKLGNDRDLVDQFDMAKNGELCIQGEYIYQQGFQDCVYLLRWLGLF